MSQAPSVLCYGSDERLIETRNWVLDKAGFASTITTHTHEYQSLLLANEYAVILLCHALNPQSCDSAIAMALRCQPQSRLLLLQAAAAGCSHPAVTVLDALAGPYWLLQRLEQLRLQPKPKG